MRNSSVALAFVALAGFGCAQTPVAEQEPVAPALLAYVLDDVPSDVANKTFVDFDGKVAIAGYEVEPSGVVRPGGRFKVRLYWRASAPLGTGWRLFTHLLTEGGERIRGNFDNTGPLRELAGDEQALPPSRWIPGKVYVDEQELMVPTDVDSSTVTIAVGVWKDQAPGYRLNVLSGASDGDRRAIITHIPTGLPRKTPSPASAKPAEGNTDVPSAPAVQPALDPARAH